MCGNFEQFFLHCEKAKAGGPNVVVISHGRSGQSNLISPRFPDP
jgi:hypothetical protein